MTDLAQHRQQFPAIADKTYFNYGGQGTLPTVALNAIIASYDKEQIHGPFSIAVNQWVNHITKDLKQAITDEVRAQPENIVLTENVTAGCNIALWGIPWQTADEILISDCEHPGVIGIVQEISARFGVKINICPLFDTLNAGDPVAVIAQHLTPKTRLLVMSHLLWNTGQVLPLKEICELCHGQNVQVLADAAQSMGSLALNLTELGVDYYAFTGHKWCCGPAGVGGLYVSPQAIHSLRPTFIGWRGMATWNSPTSVGLTEDARQYEVATSAYPLYVGLTEAIRLHQRWGTPETRYAQICAMSAYCWEKLNAIPAVECLTTTPPASGLVSFIVKSDQPHKQIVATLEERGFYVRTITYPDCIRACTHYFTSKEEIDRLAIALQKLIEN